MFVIRSLADLKSAPDHKQVNGFLERLAVKLDLPNVALSKQLHWQRKLDALQRRCGCTTAAIVMLAGLITISIYLYQQAALLSIPALFAHFIIGFIATLLLAMMAKTFTLLFTQVEFKRVCQRILSDFR